VIDAAVIYAPRLILAIIVSMHPEMIGVTLIGTLTLATKSCL
jgi:hypothetical protein